MLINIIEKTFDSSFNEWLFLFSNTTFKNVLILWDIDLRYSNIVTTLEIFTAESFFIVSPGAVSHQLGFFGHKGPEDGVSAQVMVRCCVVWGPKDHHLTLDHIHTGLGCHYFGPCTWMEREKKEENSWNAETAVSRSCWLVLYTMWKKRSAAGICQTQSTSSKIIIHSFVFCLLPITPVHGRGRAVMGREAGIHPGRVANPSE